MQLRLQRRKLWDASTRRSGSELHFLIGFSLCKCYNSISLIGAEVFYWLYISLSRHHSPILSLWHFTNHGVIWHFTNPISMFPLLSKILYTILPTHHNISPTSEHVEHNFQLFKTGVRNIIYLFSKLEKMSLNIPVVLADNCPSMKVWKLKSKESWRARKAVFPL
jgi:hypothetical protein